MRLIWGTLITLFAALTPCADVVRGGGFDRAIAVALPRVVKLYGLRAGLEAGYGTGVIVSEDGLVLTVFSLLIDARRIRAAAYDGTPYEADVVYRDRVRQLALLQLKPVSTRDRRIPARRDSSRSLQDASRRAGSRVKARSSLGLPFFDLSREASLRPGDWVLAAGNAFKVAHGSEPVSLAHGVFSTRTRLDARRRVKDFPYRGEVLVIDAITSNPGAPGSALVNLEGEFVGMIGREVVSNLTHTHLNFAMPRDVLYEFFMEATADGVTGDEGPRRLSAFGGAGQSRFDPGIRLSRLGYWKVLPFVEHVRADSPAQRAGVRKDDLILAVNGRNVADVAAYEARLQALAPDEPIDLVVRRGQAILTIRIENVNPSGSQKVKTP